MAKTYKVMMRGARTTITHYISGDVLELHTAYVRILGEEGEVVFASPKESVVYVKVAEDRADL